MEALQETRRLADSIGHGRLIEFTRELARSAAWDAGNRSMLAGGRAKWNHEDYNAASAEFARLMPMEDQN
jgi:hypothetical protein